MTLPYYHIKHIKRIRDEGKTLREIAEPLGTSRQRIHQILVKHYGTAKPQGPITAITTHTLVIYGYYPIMLYSLEKRGVIKKVGYGRWELDTLDKIREYRRCVVCGKELGKGKRHYCSTACYLKSLKHRYMNLPEDKKKAHAELVKRWLREHPERASEIRRKASIKYYMKHRIYKHLQFDSIIPIKYGEKLEKYPYQTRVIRKEDIKLQDQLQKQQVS